MRCRNNLFKLGEFEATNLCEKHKKQTQHYFDCTNETITHSSLNATHHIVI